MLRLACTYRKVIVSQEEVSSPSELTKERQKQIENTETEWILFLDDDDWWPKDHFEEMLDMIKRDQCVDGYSVDPYQLIDKDHYDSSWNNKSFTKFFRNKPGLHYRGGWPRDLIYLNDSLLYWKKNIRVPRLGKKFFHLSYLKDNSFRKETWAKQYESTMGIAVELPINEKENAKRIFEYCG